MMSVKKRNCIVTSFLLNLNSPVVTIIRYSVTGLSTILLPPFFASVNLTYPRDIPFEGRVVSLFTLTAALFLLVNGYWECRRFQFRFSAQFFSVITGLLIGFSLLAFMAEKTSRHNDYSCYEEAAKDILKRENPYKTAKPADHGYLYPPLPAMTLAVLYRVGGAIINEQFAENDLLWSGVYYLFQCSQFFQVLLAFYLCILFAGSFQKLQIFHVLIIGALFICNVPFIRTIAWGQLTLWILNPMLLGLYIIPAHPFIAGLCFAFGAHIKLYPLLFFIPLIAGRQWKALFGMIVGSCILFLGVLPFFSGIEVWKNFFMFWHSFEPFAWTRDSSIFSFIVNTIRFCLTPFIPQLQPWTRTIARIMYLCISILLVLLLAARNIHRFPIRNGSAPECIDVKKSLCEAVIFMMLLSPIIWPHHFVLMLIPVIPICIRRDFFHNRKVVFSLLSLFTVPVFALYPFSYHRLAGLFLLLRVGYGTWWRNDTGFEKTTPMTYAN